MPNSEKYTALISPDAFEYLDELPEDAFTSDEMLEEQEELEYERLFGDDDEYEEMEDDMANTDDSSLYSSDLFSLTDEFDETDEPGFDETGLEETHVDETNAEETCAEETHIDEPHIDESPEEETKVEENAEEDQDDGGNLMFEDSINDDLEVAGAMELKVSQELLSLILTKVSKYSPVKEYLRGCSEEQLEELEKKILEAKDAWEADRKDKMFSINDTNIVFAVLTDTEDPMVDIQRMEKIAITMFANKKSEPWSAVYLYFDEDGLLKDARDREITRSLFTDRQWKTIEILGRKLADRI